MDHVPPVLMELKSVIRSLGDPGGSAQLRRAMCNVAGFAASLQTLEEGKKLAQNRKGVGRRCGSLFFPYSADHRNKMRRNT